MMMNVTDFGRLLLILGGAIVLLGLGLLLVGRIPFFGRLPGDISIQRGNSSFFFLPIVSCLLLSVVLTVLVNVLLFLFRRH